MKKKIDAFTEEFSDNFSELFVESFFIKFLTDYPEKYLLENLKKVMNLTNQKIKFNIIDKLIDNGYENNEIMNYFE